MKLEDLIKRLEELKNEHGNLDVYIAFHNDKFLRTDYAEVEEPSVSTIKIYEEGYRDKLLTTKKAIVL